MVDGRIAVGRLVRYINKAIFYGKHLFIVLFLLLL